MPVVRPLSVPLVTVVVVRVPGNIAFRRLLVVVVVLVPASTLFLLA
jgi:hypothetical protein